MFVKRNERVAQEAAALAVARHPGVVDLVDVVDGALRTRLVESRTVAELPPLPAAEVAGLAAAVATTLADLHDLGQVHGGIDATHVLVGHDGRPLLCSLGRGGDPADDVAALGRLITAQLAAAPTEARGHRRLGRRRLGPLLAPPAGPTLAALAVEATAPDPADRPGARALAEAIGRRVPAARLPRPTATSLPNRVRNPAPGRPIPLQVPPAPPVCAPPDSLHDQLAARRRGWRPGVPAAGVTITGIVGSAVLLGLLTVLTPVGSRLLSRHAPAANTTSPAPDPTVTPAAPGTTTVSPPPTTRVAERVWPADPLDFRDGVLIYGGARYALGQPGDALVAGDWRCTGRPTLALLRRGAGEVFAFDSWPVGTTTVVGRSVGQVEGATNLRVVEVDGDGCHELEVERAGAAPVRLRVAS